MQLFGDIEAKIDTKGRAFLPSVFRKALQASGEENLFLCKDIFESCLVLYPESVWYKQLDVVRSKLSRWNRQHQLIYRQFVSDVEMLALDGSGRILIPKRYLKMAFIDQTIEFIGLGERIELWRPDKEKKPFMEPNDFSEAIQNILGNTFEGNFSESPLYKPRQE
ncbi:MAG: cell division/cell wall cluster transcriptional repressor MraZ [Prevotella sp.]|nr:cell division/cell wall cluster transcriptional repressor MraZ [Prevotella sp.]MBR5061963.1 cell division/cell wall cluster transcriptional repressor MraZ [Prevotella sp.]